MYSKIRLLSLLLLVAAAVQAQPERWQQRVKYVMDIDVDVKTNRFTGKQQLEYWNNSPDTLYKVFYHLYWNAFRPNSMMDVRSQELGKNLFSGRPDWDSRVRDRISKLTDNEMGYQHVKSLKMDGRAQKIKERETILEVILDKPILPNSSVKFVMDFEAQVPVQIRRSGRDNAEGIRYSMAQWYPKLCEYDYEGWHPNPYVAREFYGVWGDYDVNITIDKSYVLGGTGYLTNASQIGYGYENKGEKVVRPKGDKLTWKFTAPNVHDFVWAADPTYQVVRRDVPNGPSLFVLYKPTNKVSDQAWEKIAVAAEQVLPYIEKNFGKYPYKQYSFIQGGDGGMEYPMATLLKSSGLGTVFHEWMHSWYQMILATNESLYPWMDEGFTSFADSRVAAYYKKLTDEAATHGATRTGPADAPVTRKPQLPLYHNSAYQNYYSLVKSGVEEPLTTHADHYVTNVGYSISSYSKGEVFLAQLGYIIGEEARDKALLEYYRIWKFKHPNINDFIRVAEKVSGLELQWYRQYWVNTTKTIDYAVEEPVESNGAVTVTLKRIGHMPMPIDVEVNYTDGTKELHYIPMNLMFGEKAAENDTKRIIHEDWKWTHPTYTFPLSRRISEVKSIEIDPTKRLADIDQSNNSIEL